ncbi:DUF5906 domain-containing protein [Staphylococcus hominis]|uniref:DUF5906 domain-containing protein n=1 Tax=Staphylococcus hominis TaxID=1290 RepID=UPI0012DCC13F|nr:DUF5906 domain-containing protein [Staphylococcus hominis]MCI2847747.1 DUF5906 domain-containing protein [Staphylococcus hominis]MCI2849766.1 DUF5906 domain-containing protein [Staphylococcus hominis]MCI2856528.1 DUF5906 domain-containing protein [Staphylococcus hominis]MCI2886922.1 DUF5906 domain-containing protein [Staphylococcus hominis]MDS3852140.1 DUF5906 domain-containing protein [Staphylococcus hominis]
MNNTMKLAKQLLSENKEAIDRNGLIALLQSQNTSDNEEDLPQAEAIYNLLIEELNFEISTDINYRSNIYSYYGIKNKPKDTDLVQMATQILNVKRFESKLFMFSKEGWQKLDDSELRSIVRKTIQVILIDYTPTQSELKSVIDGMKESADIDELVEDERYIGCHRYLFDLEQFQVINNSIDIFPKTRLDVELDKSDSITSSIPPYFSKYISELANFDANLQQFLIRHTAVLLTSNRKLRRGLIFYGKANNGKSVYIKLMRSFFYRQDVVSKTLNELGGKFDKESLIGKRLMASDEIGQSKIDEKTVNDFKKLLSVEPIHVDRKGRTQVEVTLDLKLLFNTNAVLNFPPEHAKALERRITIIPCDYYVEKADIDLNDKLKNEKKDIFLYLMYVYKQMMIDDIDRIENEKVTELTHDWLNFGYVFMDKSNTSRDNQKECIKLLRNTIVKKESSRLKVSDLNNQIKRKLSLSSQNIKQLVKLNFDTDTVLKNGYEYWIDLDWKTIKEENGIIPISPNDKEINEIDNEDIQDDWVSEEDDEL